MECGTRNAGCGVREWPYSLVNIAVSVVQKWFGRGTRISEYDGRKRGHLGHYKKTFFTRLEKDGFLAVFENCPETHIAINNYRCFINPAFLVFTPKRVKNRFKKNIVSNLP